MWHGFNRSFPAADSIPAPIGARGRKDLTIECGELYWSVSKLPVFDPWMIFCCNAMRAEMATTDRLIFDDSKASLLTIHYALPRHQGPPPTSN